MYANEKCTAALFDGLSKPDTQGKAKKSSVLDSGEFTKTCC